MEKSVFSSLEFSETPDNYYTLDGYTKDEASKEDPWFQMDESEVTGLLSSIFSQENIIEKRSKSFWYEHDSVSDNDVMLPKIKENLEAKKLELFLDKPRSFPHASLELLNSYCKGFKMPRKENVNDLNNETIQDSRRLSTEEILKLAGERFIQFFTNKIDGISMFIHPYDSSISSLSIDEARDVELVNLLLAAAENVGTHQFDVASKLISRCMRIASDSGTPVQRLAFYFSDALGEKIDKESKNIPKKRDFDKERKGLALGTNNTFLTSHQELPFVKVMQFAGIQAIIENVKENENKKIHLIDLQIRSGIQWTALMQGLVEYQIQYLKITAIGTIDQKYIEETGTRLLSFAMSVTLPFLFKVVYVNDMKDFREDLLNIEADETVVVYSFLLLRSMLSEPDRLENLMMAITRIKPDLMVVIEVEANHNSPSFIGRFTESLFFYAAFFDCLEDCMENNCQWRMILESEYFGQGILNIVATEGEERVTRNVKIDVWRAFLERYGMTEIELSESSRFQASLVLKQFVRGSSCTLECNGKGLVVGWKGTPVHSLTIWKF